MNCESDAMYRLIRTKPQHSSSDSGVFSIQPSEWLFRIGNSVGCFDMLKAFISSMHPRGSAPPESPSSHNIFLCIFSGTGGAPPYLVRGAPYLGGREQRRVLAHSAERPKEPLMYTVGYYNDEDFRAFYSGQDAANIDDFFTDNGEYLMVYLPEVTDREFLAGLRYGNGCDALCQSGYALDEAEEALRDMYALAV